MPIDDRTRLNLHRRLDAVLGREEADTLMAHLPPVTWNEVATKEDVRTLETALRSEMHVGFAELRTEMAGQRTEMHVGFAELRTEMADAMTRQIKWMVTFAAAGAPCSSPRSGSYPEPRRPGQRARPATIPAHPAVRSRLRNCCRSADSWLVDERDEASRWWCPAEP